MAYLFDTDAISELLRPRPLPAYVAWLSTVVREEQFTSAVVIGELYKGAYRSEAAQRHLANIERLILPAVTALPYDVSTAKVFGQARAHLEEAGIVLPDADLPRPQKATALVPTFCGRDYGRDVVPLSLAVREANRRN